MNQEKGTAEKEALRNASVWKTLLRILVYLKDYRLQLVLALLMAVVTAVASVGERTCSGRLLTTRLSR